jgi:PAS domain S-box-containing protein
MGVSAEGRLLGPGVLVAPRGPAQLLARCLLLGVLFVVAGQLALRSNVPGSQLALVWPSSGIAALWLLTSTRSSRWPDLAGLAAATLISSLISGPPWELVPFRVVSALAMALLFRVLVDGWTPLRRPDGSLRVPTGLATFVALAGAAVVAGFLQASVQELGSNLVTEPSWTGYLHRWLRNTIAIWTMVTTALLLLGRGLAAAGPDSPGQDEHALAWLKGPDHRPWELGALLVLAVALYLFSYGLFPSLPLTFVLFLPSAWAGVRLPPARATTFGLALGVVAVALTLAGIGPYAAMDAPLMETFVAQAFLAIVFGTTLLLSVTRTELAVAERRSAERAQLLDQVLSSVGDGIALVEEDGRVVMINRAASRMLGLPDDGVSRVDEVLLASLHAPDGTELTPDRLHHVRTLAGETVRDEDVVVRPAGRGPDRIIRVTAQLMPTPPGSPRQVLVTAHDVTDERAHSTALGAFAGEVAHDLKNPLAVVEGWSEMLEAELRAAPQLDSEDGLRMLARVQGAAAHMRTLIGELLTYTLARDQELRPERTVLREQAVQVERMHQRPVSEEAPSPRIELDCDDVVWADPVLLRQLLDNLVGNAVKYVADDVVPHVRVRSRRVFEDRVEVRVEDNGIGVAPADRHRVFASLYRVEQNGYPGTGLGLAICQRIVERHGGSIWVEDGPGGRGTAFVFTLPAVQTT